ncbi:MAG: YdeI/OmpD-associated family protein [Anaerolineae bacterium]|nr:YdeI/OmpD-associated family protein [Anaerolineae bacterium]
MTFTTTLLQEEGMNATGIAVPPEIVAELSSKKRTPVKVTINGFTYRTTIATSGDVFMLPVSAERRDAAGIKAGDEVAVTLELDTEPRTVEVPDDLAAALAEKPGARETFDALAYSKRKEFVRQVEDAKTQETRQRRIDKIVAGMSDS